VEQSVLSEVRLLCELFGLFLSWCSGFIGVAAMYFIRVMQYIDRQPFRSNRMTQLSWLLIIAGVFVDLGLLLGYWVGLFSSLQHHFYAVFFFKRIVIDPAIVVLQLLMALAESRWLRVIDGE
jgi:hypothetical protein